MYSISRQHQPFNEDRISLEDVPLEDPLNVDTMPLEELCVSISE